MNINMNEAFKASRKGVIPWTETYRNKCLTQHWL